MAKISDFIIGIILVGLVTSILGLFIAEMGTNYGIDYDNSSFEAYNSLESMQNLSEEIEDRSNIDEDKDLLDVIGGYFSSAYSALRLTGASFETFSKMSQQAIEDSNLGAIGGFLQIAFSSIVIIIIFLAIFISAIVKRDL